MVLNYLGQAYYTSYTYFYFFLSLSQVPGVAENRPSVLRGDDLTVYLSEDKTQPITTYKGYVHRVELESVKLGFSKK